MSGVPEYTSLMLIIREKDSKLSLQQKQKMIKFYFPTLSTTFQPNLLTRNSSNSL